MNSQRLLLAPLLILAASAVTLMVAGVFAWGAAREVGAEDWQPTYAGALVGSVVFAGSVYCLRELQKRTLLPYRLRTAQLYLGLAFCIALTGLCLLSAVGVGDPNRYHARFESTPHNVSWDDPSLEPGPFVVVIALICFPGPISWALYAVRTFYVGAIQPVSSEVVGIDPMGQIMGEFLKKV